jgi:hypothetical protein
MSPNDTVPQSKDRRNDLFISDEKHRNTLSLSSAPDLPIGDNPETVGGSSKGQRQASKSEEKASWWKNHDVLLSEYVCQLVSGSATDDAEVLASNPDRNTGIADEIISTFSKGGTRSHS